MIATLAPLPVTSHLPRVNRFRPWAIVVSSPALNTLKQVLATHLALYAKRSNTGLLIPFREEELHLLWACLPDSGGNVVLTRETIKLLGDYTLYLTRQTARGVQTLLPGECSLMVAYHIRKVLYATISPTRILFELC